MSGVGEKVRWISFGVLVFVVGVSWALASPIGSSPDDTFHVPSIWCSATASDDLCDDLGPSTERDGYREVRVAETIGNDMSCYRYNQFQSANCQPKPSDDRVVTYANDDLYPDGYYWLMGPFASSNVVQSIALIRVVNFVLCIGLIALATWLASPDIRRVAPLGIAVTSVPMMLFLFSSNNPSGLLVAAVASAWIALSSAFRHVEVNRRRASFAVGFVAVALALLTRSDAGLYVLIALVAVVLGLPQDKVSSPTRHRMLIGLSFLAVAGLVLAALTRYPGAGVFVGMQAENYERPMSGVIFENLRSITKLWVGPLGEQPLGWLDTSVPPATTFISTALFVLVVVTGMARSSVSSRRASWLVLAAMFIIPMYMMAADRSFVGEGFQSRYLLPLLPILAMTALGWTSERGEGFAAAALKWGVVALSFAHAVVLHVNIRRYVTGIEVLGMDLEHNSEWWWTWGPSANTLWVVGSFAFLGAGVLLLAPPRVLVKDR